jgi:hypothetical protein
MDAYRPALEAAATRARQERTDAALQAYRHGRPKGAVNALHRTVAELVARGDGASFGALLAELRRVSRDDHAVILEVDDERERVVWRTDAGHERTATFKTVQNLLTVARRRIR